jgi:hypothetical protein
VDAVRARVSNVARAHRFSSVMLMLGRARRSGRVRAGGRAAALTETTDRARLALSFVQVR